MGSPLRSRASSTSKLLSRSQAWSLNSASPSGRTKVHTSRASHSDDTSKPSAPAISSLFQTLRATTLQPAAAAAAAAAAGDELLVSLLLRKSCSASKVT